MVDRGIADQLEHLVGALRAQDGLVGRGERREHPRDPLSRPLAGEVLQSKGDVRGHAFHQADRLTVQRSRFAEIEHENADVCSVGADRHGGCGAYAELPACLVPRSEPFLVEIIVGNAGAVGAKRLAGKSSPVDGARIHRDLRTFDHLQSLAAAAGGVAQGTIGLREQHHGGLDLALVHRGIADPLIEILLRRGAQHGLVRRAQRREHPRKVCRYRHRIPRSSKTFLRFRRCAFAAKCRLSSRVNGG